MKMRLQLLAIAATVACVAGHGRLVDPPSRASAWRYGYNTRPNYDDDGLNCGGFYHQYSVTGGRCGICGDRYDQSEPRPHELGGIYGSGIIVANYDASQVFSTTVQISAYHKGYWEFRICTDPRNNEQECFDDYILELEDGGTKYYPTAGGTYVVNYRLPDDLVCEHCVLQWKYTCGNNWGVCTNGTQGLGCGNQETFWACSDIVISPPLPLLLGNSIEMQGLLNMLRMKFSPALRGRRTKPHKHKKKRRPRKQKTVHWMPYKDENRSKKIWYQSFNTI